MKIPVRTEYALRALMALAENEAGGIVPIKTISEQQRMPKRFLEQILHDLKSGGFVESRRGVSGGYRLARPAEDINLAALMRHLGGPLTSESAGGKRTHRARLPVREEEAVIRAVVAEVRQAVLAMLGRFSLADLCARVRRLRNEAHHRIDYMI